jgi:hypothetical protein
MAIWSFRSITARFVAKPQENRRTRSISINALKIESDIARWAKAKDFVVVWRGQS